MDISQLLPQVIAIAKRAGQFILKEGADFDRSKIEEKGLNDLVSYVDKESERQIVQALQKLLPGSGFIVEEGTSPTGEKDWTWIIDPLDGTTNFLHGLPVFAVSIALAFKRKAVLGVVYEPNRDECFYATAEGAFCNGELMRVSEVGQLKESLIATGFPYYRFGKMPAYLKILEEFMRSCHGLRRMGSAAVDLAYVACGRFQGFFEYNLKPWDVAAGAYIVKLAGGQVTDFGGGNNYIFGKEIIASNSIAAEMRETVQKYWKD